MKVSQVRSENKKKLKQLGGYKKVAKFYFKYGAMNSGKTNVLINTAHNYLENKLGVLIAKPSTDTKAGTKISSRNGLEKEVDILLTPKMDIKAEINKIHKKINCILVDETQMLEPKQIDQLYEITKIYNISVICFGLRTDFQSRMFPSSKRAMELADSIEKIPTMCKCGNQAEFNCRKKGDAFVFDGAQIAIDGKDNISYEPLCGSCYLKQKTKAQQSDISKKCILESRVKGR